MKKLLILMLCLLLSLIPCQSFCPDALGQHSKLESDSNLISWHENSSIFANSYTDTILHDRSSGVMETLVVIDKDLGDHFHQNMQSILDYLTVYFWDVNLRLKTILGEKLSVKVIGVHVISDYTDQPFIELAKRNYNQANYTDLLGLFNLWLHSDGNPFKNFDIAMLLTNTEDIEGTLGRARGVEVACEKYYSGVVVHDTGTWSTVTVGTHEIGHIIGAPHDNELPNGETCGVDTLMGSGDYNTLKKRWFFSICSNRRISKYVRSNDASCLRKQDHREKVPIDPSFSSVRAPSMKQQCQRMTGSPFAYVAEADTHNCTMLKCVLPIAGGSLEHHHFNLSLDNTMCHKNGRCFRGRCRQPGSLVMNLSSRKCLFTVNKFHSESSVELVPCPSPLHGTPLDRFLIIRGTRGMMLATPYQSPGGDENGEACILYNKIMKEVRTSRCDFEDKQQRWDVIDTGKGEVMLRHRQSKKCAKQVGNQIKMSTCNRYIPQMRWIL